ncbi:hypothetical protein FXB41_13895 [Bradyrhizobium canariense]|uniref:hypothetical protein n=1 Tax=Bradyrhizobium canariense TaxID=255045 RepID=UPI001CA54703|nr:hypothetical protein [Bradyrhizobium canariense]MBW5435836.1 hypothetical protein [Bradyrhizobium canariense]
MLSQPMLSRELIPEGLVFTRSVVSDQSLTEEQAPLDLGALGTSDRSTALKLDLDFKVSTTTGHPNLLQTDAANQGLRVELGGRVLALIVGSRANGVPYQAIPLFTKLSIGTWHHLTIRIVGGRYVDVALDGLWPDAMRFDKPFSMRNTRVGIGFDDLRRFRGDLKNIHVSVGSSPLFRVWLAIVNIRIEWFLGLFAIVLLQRYFAHHPLSFVPSDIDIQRAGILKHQLEILLTKLPLPLICLSILLNLSAALYSAAIRHFLQESDFITRTLLPGFQRLEGAPPFNSQLLLFMLVEMSLVGTLAVFWFATPLGKPELDRIPRKLIAGICALSAAHLLIAYGISAKILVACAIVMLLILLAPWPYLTFTLARRPVLATLAVTRRSSRSPQLNTASIARLKAATMPAISGPLFRISPLARKSLALVAGLLVCAVLAWPVLAAWYPVIIPNDYLEAVDRFRLKTSTGTIDISRDQMSDCLSKMGAKDGTEEVPSPNDPPATFSCAGLSLSVDEWSGLQDSLVSTTGWQGEVGRTLFHHSYIFVPAQHLLTYGIDRAVPYLYGYGNTLMHAALMRLDGGPTLSSYFSTFPVAELAGIAGIALLVLLVGRSGWVAVAAFALSLAAFYSITYVPVFLAASFSPARYVGLLFQLASICVCCRNPANTRLLLLLPLAAAASLFWNTEFALLGLVGQGLLTIAPVMQLTLMRRILLLGSLAACALVYPMLFWTSPDIIRTVQLSFFNIGMPFLGPRDALWFFASLIAIEAGLFGLALLFLKPERTLRLCYLPVLGLLIVKYIYNPSSPHLYLVHTLLWPALLLYLPPIAASMRPFIAVVAVCIAAVAGSIYKSDAAAFRKLFADDYAISNWPSLGESIGFVAPEEPISERVASIREHIGPDDTLIFLSPFDQVLSFYVNPKTVCGHFDILSNLASHAIEDVILACATRSPKTLIVYDRATESPCPTGYLQTQSRCALKATTKANLTALRDKLLPSVKLVGSDRNLLFYRPEIGASEDKSASREQ